jgi:uncharacterized protein (DUF1778 family)
MTLQTVLPSRASDGNLTLEITVTARQARLLRQAAMTSSVAVENFIADSACAAAYSLLVDHPEFLLDDPDWEHFLSLLDQPASELDELKTLLETDG